MKHIFKSLKKEYININITLICIYVYVLFVFPTISPLLEKISPLLTKCPYLNLTGKPCPLCGGTRFLQNIGNVFYDIHYILNRFGVIALLIVLEIVFRIINIVKKEDRERIILLDIIIHIFLLTIYIIYSIYFITI